MLWSYVLKGDVGEQLCSPWHVIIVGINLHLIGFRLSPDFATLFIFWKYFLFFFLFLLFMCANKAWVISPPWKYFLKDI
jgi:hypothetical protein